MASKLKAGDIVAYTVKHLRATNQTTGNAGARRGEYLGESGTPGYSLVKWRDFEALADRLAELYGADYVAHCREHGELAPTGILCAAKPSTDFCAC